MTSPSRRLVAIEALRGGAALSVVILHSLGASVAMGMAWPGLQKLAWPAGVDVFFVISGFIMIHASRGWFGRAGGRRRFVVHRVARVVPLYWIATTVFAGLALIRPGAFTDALDGWRNLLTSYLFIPWRRLDGSMLPVFRLGWTLQYEMLFYAIFALWLGCRQAVAVPAIFVSLAALVVLGCVWPSAPAAIGFWTDPIVLEFAFGMAIGIAHGEGVCLPLVFAPVLTLCAFALFWWAGSDPGGWHRPFVYGVPASLLVALALLREGHVIGPYLRWIALQAGSLSYALYLSHLFAVRAVRETWRFVPFGSTAFLPVAICSAIALATVVHHFVERPAVSAVRRWLGDWM